MMPITLHGGPYDGVEWPNRHFPRCPEILGFTDDSVDGLHVYATNGPSESVNEYGEPMHLTGRERAKIDQAILSGEIEEPSEFWHQIYYEGTVKRTSVLNLWRNEREGGEDGTSVSPRSQ